MSVHCCRWCSRTCPRGKKKPREQGPYVSSFAVLRWHDCKEGNFRHTENKFCSRIRKSIARQSRELIRRPRGWCIVAQAIALYQEYSGCSVHHVKPVAQFVSVATWSPLHRLMHAINARTPRHLLITGSAAMSPSYIASIMHGGRRQHIARRFISYQTTPAPASKRQRMTRSFLIATASSATGVALYYAMFAPTRLAESSTRDYSSTVKLTDTATHPRNYRMTVADPKSVSTLLKTNEKSTYLPPGSGNEGILSYHFNQVASNSPIEDDHVEAHVKDGSTDWSFFGVMDGHSGWTTSARLKQDLVPYVTEALTSVDARDATAVSQALQKGFVNLDREIVYNSADQVLQAKNLLKSEAVALLMPALSGSCALLASYNAASRFLHVAVTGDSRAIFVRQVGSEWRVSALSEDQTGSTASEVARLKSEHPNEENVVRNGRILGGLEPSRAFGDSRYKWSTSTQAKIADKFYGRRAPAALLSPPYVTARPEVTSTQVDLSEKGFLVLGTDGLYEMLTNEEIAELVVGWRQKYQPSLVSSSSWLPTFLGGSSMPKIKDEDDQRTGQKSPHVKSTKNFVYQDDNVATHIIRNALGGGDTDRLYGLLSLPYPLSRSYRDDISVTVVFFGEDKDRMQTDPLEKSKL